MVFEEATDNDLSGHRPHEGTIFRDSDKGGWMLIEPDDAHNAVWVSPTSEARLEYAAAPPAHKG